MPFANEHAARVQDPGRYEKFRWENGKFGEDIDATWGITDNGEAGVQSIRFDSGKFSVEEARE